MLHSNGVITEKDSGRCKHIQLNCPNDSLVTNVAKSKYKVDSVVSL